MHMHVPLFLQAGQCSQQRKCSTLWGELIFNIDSRHAHRPTSTHRHFIPLSFNSIPPPFSWLLPKPRTVMTIITIKNGRFINLKPCLLVGCMHAVNSDECLMTRMQEMSLDYHFTVEQEVGSSTYAFFGFNGTAGVWRIAAINEAGGWKARTTVEDMDLAVRASLRGWKFLYLGDLQVKNELPSTFKAFRYQQHRWSCGPANLFKKMVGEIIKNKVCWISSDYVL